MSFKNVKVVGNNETVKVGDHELAISGNHGTATAGFMGKATAGEGGIATAGDVGKATVGPQGKAKAGNGGLLIFEVNYILTLTFRVGIDPGVKPDVMYTLDLSGHLREYVKLGITKRRKF